jgi:hypothetical protein
MTSLSVSCGQRGKARRSLTPPGSSRAVQEGEG